VRPSGFTWLSSALSTSSSTGCTDDRDGNSTCSHRDQGLR
jgi:hypothetical protein